MSSSLARRRVDGDIEPGGAWVGTREAWDDASLVFREGVLGDLGSIIFPDVFCSWEYNDSFLQEASI